MRIPPVNDLIVSAFNSAQLERGALSRLAEECGTGRNAPSTWVSGRVTPEPKYWEAIERLLAIPSGTLARAAADYFDPNYAELRRRVVDLARDNRDLERQVDELTDATRPTGLVRPDVSASEARRSAVRSDLPSQR